MLLSVAKLWRRTRAPRRGEDTRIVRLFGHLAGGGQHLARGPLRLQGADTAIDGVISAVVFGAIALCAFIFDAAAVRL